MYTLVRIPTHCYAKLGTVSRGAFAPSGSSASVPPASLPRQVGMAHACDVHKLIMWRELVAVHCALWLCSSAALNRLINLTTTSLPNFCCRFLIINAVKFLIVLSNAY